MQLNRLLISELSLAGIILDALGGLYLAYDLLGGKRGPLRILSRAVTYSVVFGIGYGIGFGPLFGVVAGLGLGSSLALESAVIASELTNPTLRAIIFSIIRGGTLGVASWLTFGARFGALFGLAAAVALEVVYLSGLAPIKLYSTIGRPKFTREGFIASLCRASAIGGAAFLTGVLLRDRVHAEAFALEVGVVVGIVSLFVTTVSPFVEWWVDSLPERKLGALGAALVVAGFLLQAVQYLAIILKIPIAA